MKSTNEDFIVELTNDNSNDEQSDTINTPTCSHCGKWSDFHFYDIIYPCKENAHLMFVLSANCTAIDCFVFYWLKYDENEQW